MNNRSFSKPSLQDVAIRKIYEKFFSSIGSDESEFYADWSQLREPLLACLLPEENSSSPTPPRPLQIIFPGGGVLSEHLYDAGFHCISNINLSKVAISEMLRRTVRSRPEMKWRVMDMTKMQFVNETFDGVLDTCGLDGLMVPELGPKLGDQYLSEVKRVLQKRGKFICLTLGQSHVLGTLFPKFRYEWRVILHVLPQKPSKHSLQIFMVIAEKDSSSMLHTISLSFDPISLPSMWDQGRKLSQALETENKVRAEFFNESEILYTPEDPQVGAKGNLTEFKPGQRIHLTMGKEGHSLFVYRAVFLDYLQQTDSGTFLYDCGVFLVPKVSFYLIIPVVHVFLCWVVVLLK